MEFVGKISPNFSRFTSKNSKTEKFAQNSNSYSLFSSLNSNSYSLFSSLNSNSYSLIKNDYRVIKRLNRNREHLRGLFMCIIERWLSRLPKLVQLNFELLQQANVEVCVDICLDLQQALQQLQQDNPRLYTPFVAHYIYN